MSAKKQPNVPFAVLAIFLAWIVPGAGHVYLGRPVRGIIICLTIAATFWGGLAMGGVMTIDPVNERWWFMADMLTGVHGLVSWQVEKRVWDRLVADPQVLASRQAFPGDSSVLMAVVDRKLQEEGLALTAPTDTIARAYAGIAGLLNLMCIFDAVMLSMMGIRGEPVPAVRVPQPQAVKA